VCFRESRLSECERAQVRSNIRKFAQERFEYWRCPACRTIHAADSVNLAHYYQGYPIYGASQQVKTSITFKNYLKRLKAAGLAKHHRILDYGCGSGAMVKYLQAHGYSACGYDAYSPAFRDSSVLEQRYDCVISQDVVEHVDSPAEILRTYDRLAAPGALIAIGTPDASAIDLKDPESFVHALHAPYHRHILPHPLLQREAEKLGWRVARYYPTMYTNTLYPGENSRLGLHYLHCHDNNLDLLAEPLKLNAKLVLHPATYLLALFGYFFDRHTDIMFTFRKP
jgi:2-polyprenyl-3-methyl-5-hydroxy-6-metoxy-1,4-benzoquinol methylase